MPRARKPAQLCQSVNRDLIGYALAASAAGVGVLTLVQPAAGEIVYTSTHQTIQPRHMFALDFNHDGKTDFAIDNIFHGSHGSNFYLHWTVQVQPAPGGAIVSSGRYHCGAALKKGATIGQQGPWQSRMEVMEAEAEMFGYTFTYGNWNNVRNSYLGLRFQIDGQDHYGWARLSVEFNGNEFLAVLTGYAYETEADTPIVAGDTGGANASNENSGVNQTVGTPQPSQPATLGALALGSSRLEEPRGR